MLKNRGVCHYELLDELYRYAVVDNVAIHLGVSSVSVLQELN